MHDTDFERLEAKARAIEAALGHIGAPISEERRKGWGHESWGRR